MESEGNNCGAIISGHNRQTNINKIANLARKLLVGCHCLAEKKPDVSDFTDARFASNNAQKKHHCLKRRENSDEIPCQKH